MQTPNAIHGNLNTHNIQYISGKDGQKMALSQRGGGSYTGCWAVIGCRSLKCVSQSRTWNTSGTQWDDTCHLTEDSKRMEVERHTGHIIGHGSVYGKSLQRLEN